MSAAAFLFMVPDYGFVFDYAVAKSPALRGFFGTGSEESGKLKCARMQPL